MPFKPRPRLGITNSPPSASFSVVSSYSLRIVQVLLDFFHLPLLFANFLFFFLAENFPEDNMFSIRAMKKVRAEAGAPADGEVSMEELLTAVSERVKTLRSCGV